MSSSPAGHPAPLVERDAESAVLRAALQDLCEGRGSAIGIEGQAGIGKTRLLEAIAAEAPAELLLLRAAGAPLESDFAFGLARQLLDPALASLSAASRARLLRAGGDAVAPLFTRFATRSARRRSEGVGEVDQTYPVLAGLQAMLAELAEGSPVLAMVDDVHWGDAPSLRLLAFVARRVDSAPLMLVFAGRPEAEWGAEQLGAELAGDQAMTWLRPRPLSQEAASTVLADALSEPVEADFASAAHEATGGNPFYLRELARTVAARGVEPVSERAIGLGDMGPEAVARSVVARIQASEPGALTLARAAAVLGDSAPLALVATLAGITPEQAGRTADALRAVAVFAHRPEVRFEHSILRAAVYESMPVGERALLHGRAAALLRERDAELDAVASQLHLAEPETVVGAVDLLQTCARDARLRGAPDLAAVHLRRALAERPSSEERAEILLELGLAEALSRGPEAKKHLVEAMTLARSDDDRLAAALALYTTQSFDGHAADGLQTLRSALEEPGEADQEMVLRLELELARATRSCVSTAAEGRERIAALSSHLEDEPGTVSRLALGLVAYDAMLANRPAADVAEIAERCLPLEDSILEERESQLLHPPLYTLIWCDRIEQALGLLDGLIGRARDRGSVIGVTLAMSWRALGNLRAGRLRDAERDAQLALDGAIEHGWRFGQASSQLWLFEAALERGDVGLAGERLARIEAAIETGVDDKGWTSHVRHGRARLKLATGDARRALDDLLEIGRRHERWLVRCPSELAWRSDAALAAHASGDDVLARRLAQEELELAREFGAPRALGIALRVSGHVAGADEGIRLVEDAIEVLTDSPARLEHAYALAELGAMLRASGQHKSAREPLRAALEGAVGCGATALAERARGELVAAGARPRRDVQSGAAALTASERRIARMAGDGASNPEIAQSLFLSRKTVETHLSNAYRKLGVGSRREVAGALSTAGEPEEDVAEEAGEWGTSAS